MTQQATSHAAKLPGRIFVVGRSASLSSQIVADVRDALFAKRLKPGDVLGTENEIAGRYGVSRIVARDALRTLEALGIAEIKMGKGGGARVARGNPTLFAEALAVQLDLAGVGAAEIMDAQRAIECLAAELAAENATPADIARMRASIAEAEASIGDVEHFTRLGAEFHLAIAEASHNRVLVVQLISLQHVSWPRRNPTLTAKVMRRIVEVHKELLELIEMHDAPGARKLMDDHVKMIRARRLSGDGKAAQPSLRGAPQGRTQNPEARAEQVPGLRVRSLSRAPRGDEADGAGCC
jgi:GntR family transcriptional repressor for pyruvate dehydrogenase complex